MATLSIPCSGLITVYLSKLLVKDTLDVDLKVSIVRDIFKQKIIVHDMAGLNFSGLILDRAVLAKYIFHRCPKNYRNSLSIEDASLKLEIPGLVVDSLIYLGLLTSIKPDSRMRVMQKSISEFSEKFIGKDLLVKLLCISEHELAQRIERENIPSFNIPFRDGFERYPFIPRLAGSH